MMTNTKRFRLWAAIENHDRWIVGYFDTLTAATEHADQIRGKSCHYADVFDVETKGFVYSNR